MQAERTCRCTCGGCALSPRRRYLIGHDGTSRPYELDEESGCWDWVGARGQDGYGRLREGATTIQAHRWSYEIAKGPIPTGLVIDHLCRNTGCVNPDHLEPVTTAQNTQRGNTAKLTWEIVREIRASGLACTAAGRRFGISEMQAWRVLTHKTWKELA